MVFFFGFWFGFMKGILRQFPLVFTIFVSLILEAVHMYFIPLKFAFTYVQSALLFSSSLAELYRSDKKDNSTQYNLYAFLYHIPISIVGYFESMTCTSFFSKIGGHFWYDMTIPLSGLAYIYMISQIHNKNAKKVD